MGKKIVTTFSTRRIEALSDGIFGFAMTLLVVDLASPLITGTPTEQDLINMLHASLPTLRNFAISFLLLGSMWGIHTRQFEYITRADRHLGFINNLRLMAVVLFPFTTSLMSDYPDFILGSIWLPLNFFILAIITAYQWWYATYKQHYYENISRHDIAVGMRRNMTMVALSLVVVALVPLLRDYAMFLFLGLPLMMHLATRNVKSDNETI